MTGAAHADAILYESGRLHEAHTPPKDQWKPGVSDLKTTVEHGIFKFVYARSLSLSTSQGGVEHEQVSVV